MVYYKVLNFQKHFVGIEKKSTFALWNYCIETRAKTEKNEYDSITRIA